MRGEAAVTVGGSSVSESDTARSITGEDEVVDLCRELIRIDTSNYGDHSGPGERKAAEYVAEKLAEVGLEPQIFESHKGRASTVARIEGEDPSRPGAAHPRPHRRRPGQRRATGPTTPSPARSRTAACGAAAPST